MNRLREIRKSRGLTQEQLAEALATTNVSISRYEKEDDRLTLPLLRRLGHILGCSISDIAGETENTGKAESSYIDEELWGLAVVSAETVFKSASEVAPLPRAKIMAEVIRNTYDALVTERTRRAAQSVSD